MALVATGLALAAPATYGGSNFVRGLLFGLSPLDVVAVTAATTLSTAVAMAAAYLPAQTDGVAPDYWPVARPPAPLKKLRALSPWRTTRVRFSEP